MGEFYSEDEYYKDNGWPSETLKYSDYCFYNGHITEYGEDYDQFALVDNALYPYIRLTEKRGKCQSPCGHSSVIATDGTFARKSEAERNKDCPKIAWGFAAVYLINLKYDKKQEDYVELKDRSTLIKEYYNRYLQIYLDNHSGLKFSKLSLEQKELNYLNEHEPVIKGLWEKSTPLKKYPVLFEYASEAESDYERFLQERRNVILNHESHAEDKANVQRAIIQKGKNSIYVENNSGAIIIGTDMPKKRSEFNTEIREAFGKPYIKAFFLDDSIAADAKTIVEGLRCVRTVSITPSSSKDHPGNTLTVYPKPMVDAETCEKEIHEALNLFFSNSPQAASVRKVKTDAYFNNIEKQVINDLKGARVSILVAMAWFTNQRIADVLIEKFKEGLDVRVVSFDDHVNAKFGVDIDGIPHKKVKSPKGGIMHDKFCVIDNQKVLTGSYNWSVNAENKNVENVPVIYDDARASDYSVEFRNLFDSV